MHRYPQHLSHPKIRGWKLSSGPRFEHERIRSDPHPSTAPLHLLRPPQAFRPVTIGLFGFLAPLEVGVSVVLLPAIPTTHQQARLARATRPVVRSGLSDNRKRKQHRDGLFTSRFRDARAFRECRRSQALAHQIRLMCRFHRCRHRYLLTLAGGAAARRPTPYHRVSQLRSGTGQKKRRPADCHWEQVLK